MLSTYHRQPAEEEASPNGEVPQQQNSSSLRWCQPGVQRYRYILIEQLKTVGSIHETGGANMKKEEAEKASYRKTFSLDRKELRTDGYLIHTHGWIWIWIWIWMDMDTSYIHMASSWMKSSLMKIWSRQHKHWSITKVQRSMAIKTISILVRNRISLYFNATVSFGRIYQFIFQKRIRRIYWRRIYQCKEIGIGIKKLWRRIPKSGKNSKF